MTTAQDALIHLMIVAASSDSAMTEKELKRITALIDRLPVFEGFDKDRLETVANDCADILNGDNGLDRVVSEAVAALRARLGLEVPAVLVTADRSLSLRNQAQALGVHVLNKPVKPAALRALLAQWRATRVAAE